MKKTMAILTMITLVSLTAMAKKQAPIYKVDDSYKVQLGSTALYIAVDSKENIWGILRSGEVVGISPEGKEIKRFKPEMEGSPTTIAIDKKDNITVLSTKTEKKTFKYKGRSITRSVPVAAYYSIYDKAGKKIKDGEFKGVQSASAAHYAKDKLIIADVGQRSLIFYDLTAGKIKKKTNKGIRLCCGIFDFCVGPDDMIYVASLGAFKVQPFRPSGTTGHGFGQRGRTVNDFHGCCNPVSVAILPDKSIVTVEKDTTRVKVYDSKGKTAKLVEGIQELVKGCRHIPLAVDKKGNIYLASNKSTIIKCVKAH